MFSEKTELSGPDVDKILEDAGSVFRQLGIQKPKPDAVSAADRLPADFVMVLYGEIILPAQMVGKLTPEEWRPLIASSIIFQSTIIRRRNWGALPLIVLPLAGAVALVFVLVGALDPTRSNGTLDIALTGSVLVAPVLLMMPFLNRYSHGGRLQADREAARIVGRDSMLRSLTRVRDLGQGLNLRRRVRGYGFAPSLDQRIAKLQRYS
jgi:hypothetical protein